MSEQQHRDLVQEVEQYSLGYPENRRRREARKMFKILLDEEAQRIKAWRSVPNEKLSPGQAGDRRKKVRTFINEQLRIALMRGLFTKEEVDALGPKRQIPRLV